MKTCLARFLLRWSLLSLLAFLPFLATAQTNFQILKSFGFPGLDTGSDPISKPVIATNGMIYGTTLTGGDHELGTIYRVSTNGTGYQILHSFAGAPTDGDNVVGSLLLGSDNCLYGVTSGGGFTYFPGIIFKINLDGTGYQIIHYLTGADGVEPLAGLIEGRDGFLYGTTSLGGDYDTGTLFKLAKDGSQFQVILSINSLIDFYSSTYLTAGSDGYLYGVSSAGNNGEGYVFKLDHSGNNYSLLYQFGSFANDGTFPVGELIFGNDGFLYGVTGSGGNYGGGTVFKLSTNGTTTVTHTNTVSTNGSTTVTVSTTITGYEQLYLFSSTNQGVSPQTGLTLGADRLLYGVTSYGSPSDPGGTIFHLSTTGQNFSEFIGFTNEAHSTMAPLTFDGSTNLYLVSSGGSPAGTLLKVNPFTSMISILHNFTTKGGGDGYGPQTPPAFYSGTAYGVAPIGGSNGFGAIYKINPNGTDYTLLHSFSFSEGTDPLGTPLLASDGMLYGVNAESATYGVGSIYKLDTNGGNFSVLHSFGALNDGFYPQSALVQGADGFIYGITSGGGAYYSVQNYGGTIFKISTNGSSFQILHQFSGTDGSVPLGLTIGPDGWFYGVTSDQGSSPSGSIFKLNSDGSQFITLHTFAGGPMDGASPQYPLLFGTDGFIYGATQSGGSNLNYGALFKIDTNGQNLVLIHSFNYDGSSPFSPVGGLIQTPDGRLVGGTQAGGPSDFGVLFSITTNGQNLTVLHNFSPLGNNSFSGPILGPNGFLYGVLNSGGALNLGALYQASYNSSVTIVSLTYLPQSVMLQFSGGYSSQYYAILSAATPSGPWREIGTAAADANGNFQFTDTTSSGHTARYYRSYGP